MSDRPTEYKKYLNRDSEDADIPERTKLRLKRRRNVKEIEIGKDVLEEISMEFEGECSYSNEGYEPTTSTVNDYNAEADNVMNQKSSESHEAEFLQERLEANSLFEEQDNESWDNVDEEYETEYNDNDDTSPCDAFKNFISTENFFSNIEVPLKCSKGDIVLMILKYSVTYRLPRTAVESLFQLINCLFAEPILPNTSYIIDKMFNCNLELQFHMKCPLCECYAGICDTSKKNKNDGYCIECIACAVKINTSNVKCSECFVTFDIKNDIKELLEVNQSYYNSIVERQHSEEMQSLEDIYDGNKYKNFVNNLNESDRKNYATAILNTDGSPIFESSKTSIWPVQLLVNEIPMKERLKNVLPFGLWFGKKKADMNVFLQPIIKYLNELSTNGIECNIMGEQRCIKFYCICCCVDSAARAPMQGLRQYNGYYGCSWCLHPGEWCTESKSIKYTILNYYPKIREESKALKDIEEVGRSNTVVNGFTDVAIINRLFSFDIIDGFVVDYMHNVLLGVSRQFAVYWFLTRNNPFSLTKQQIQELNNAILKLSPHSQVGRFSRSIDEMKFWKAREWETWVLYYSLPLLSGILPSDYINHWSKLVEGLYILLQKKITVEELNRCNTLLHEFVLEAEPLYGKSSMTYNVHQLLHLSASVYNWGPLWCHNGYPFENGNGLLLKTIHGANGIPHQICRHLSFHKCLSVIERFKEYKTISTLLQRYIDKLNFQAKNTTVSEICRYIGVSSVTNSDLIFQHNLNPDNTATFQKIIIDTCMYASSKKKNRRSNNSFAILKNNQYVQCQEFLLDVHSSKEITIVKLIQTSNGFDSCHQLQHIDRISENLSAINTSEIYSPCNVIKINNNMYICAVPNNYHF